MTKTVRSRTPWVLFAVLMTILAATVGSFGALMAIRKIAGIGEDIAGNLYVFDGLALAWRKMRLPKNPGCKGCS